MCKYGYICTYVVFNRAVDNMLINTFMHAYLHMCMYVYTCKYTHTVRQIYNFIFIPLQGIMWHISTYVCNVKNDYFKLQKECMHEYVKHIYCMYIFQIITLIPMAISTYIYKYMSTWSTCVC